MIITIDLDGVVFDLNQIIKDLFLKYNLNYFPPQTWVFDGYNDNIKNELYQLFKTDKVVNTPLINDNIRDTIFALNSENSIYFVSSRFKDIHQLTIERMLKEFPYLDKSQIILTDNKSKIPILKELNSELHIDDSPSVIQECLDNKVNCIMISNNDLPYNKYLRSKVFHMETLNNIIDYLYSFNSNEYLTNFNLIIKDMFIKNH